MGKVTLETRAIAYYNRDRVYALLDDEDHQDALAAAEKLNTRKISWWASLKPDMDLPALLNLPEKPVKE